MQFEHDGWRYRIVFKHKECLDRNLAQARRTEARLMTFFVSNQQWKAVGYGVAKCAHSDHFEKEKGRKLALSRALEGRDRPFRSKAWKAYHERQGGLLYMTSATRAMNALVEVTA